MKRLASASMLVLLPGVSGWADAGQGDRFHREVQPILENYCYDCHADGMDKGGMSLDEFASDAALLDAQDQWWHVYMRLRTDTMPPIRKQQPAPEEKAKILDWIKSDVFRIDPSNPDPGHATLRRLNRMEYRNTIHDLMGVDYDTMVEFPPDDTGFGFDTVGDTLSISPLLMEKYLAAAEEIVAEAVPTVGRVAREERVSGGNFRGEGGVKAEYLRFNRAADVQREQRVKIGGDYRVRVNLRVSGAFDFEPGACTLTFAIDGEERLSKRFAWESGVEHNFEYDAHWEPGEHTLSFGLVPDPEQAAESDSLAVRVSSVTIEGPLAPEHWVPVERYARFFPRPEPPAFYEKRAAYAREVLERFTGRAFRRPAPEAVLDRLMKIALASGAAEKTSFEEGIRVAMMATLASPRFLFLSTETEAPEAPGQHPYVDEYTLASRLSYLFWSTMPDDELLGLAEAGELRANLDAQVQRLLEDQRSERLVRNFAGQWLEARDVSTVEINTRALDGGFRGRGGDRIEFDDALRNAMRDETEMLFAYIAREDRSLLELIDCEYTFVNEPLARLYGIDGVEGNQMRKVTLPEGSPRGGILTQGTVLTVTSNPTRTSPVKRGIFILENVLGTPPPSPPANVPQLEEAAETFTDRVPTLRETLEAHRSNPVCSSCHARFDPLGLALENFDALGRWRDSEHGQPIDPEGTLLTGESFGDVRALKAILTHERRGDFYRCITEKFLTYAIGRGPEFADMFTVDRITDALEAEGGKFSVLLDGVIRSAPFQKQRTAGEGGGIALAEAGGN